MKAARSGGLGERRLEIFSNKTPGKVKISLKSETPKWLPRKMCIGNQMLGLSSVRVAGFSLQHGHCSNQAAANLQHATNREQNDRCGNSTTQWQAPDDGYINIRNMLST